MYKKQPFCVGRAIMFVVVISLVLLAGCTPITSPFAVSESYSVEKHSSVLTGSSVNKEVNTQDPFRVVVEKVQLKDNQNEDNQNDNNGSIEPIEKVEVADLVEEKEDIKTKVDAQAKVETASVETKDEKGSAEENIPESKPEKPEVQLKVEPKLEPKPEPEPKPAPVSYVWGSNRSLQFRTEVVVKNNGDDLSKNVRVLLPMLENNSPYQKTSLEKTNYPIEETNGRVGTFNIGDLEVGETKTIVADYSIRIRPVSLSSTNETVETAKKIFAKHVGSGNCYTLAVAFVNEAKSAGLKARVVTGYARPQRGNMTSGSLSGSRHSWVEFYIEGLGWIPVDLTFGYFGEFPHASHVVETYDDLSIRVRFSGGDLRVEWKNAIL